MTDRCAAGRGQALLCARCSRLSPARPDSQALQVRRGSGGDPNSGSPAPGGSPTHERAQRYADDRQLASASVGRSSAERPAAGANAATSRASRSWTAGVLLAASVPVRPAQGGPLAPAEDESPADAAQTPRGAARAVRRPSPTRDDHRSRRQRAAPGKRRTEQKTTPNDHAEPSTHAAAEVIEPHTLQASDTYVSAAWWKA